MSVDTFEASFEVDNRTNDSSMLRTCRNKCIPEEYGEAELNKGETACVDRCVAKFYKANIAIGQVSTDCM